MERVAEVKRDVTDGLDAAEALGIGRGKLDAGVAAELLGDSLFVGMFGDYEHRLSETVAAFARVDLGLDTGSHSVVGRGIGGVRIRF